MTRSTKIYVAIVAGLAALWTYLMYRSAPTASSVMITDALILCGLAVAAELLSFLLPRSATGSMGFIPYFAAAIVVPSWPSVVSVILVKAAVELWTRRAPIKAVLNISSHALMELIAISTYTLLGGVSLHAFPDLFNLTHVTKVVGLAALVAFAAAHLANNIIVTGAIAFSSGR